MRHLLRIVAFTSFVVIGLVVAQAATPPTLAAGAVVDGARSESRAPRLPEPETVLGVADDVMVADGLTLLRIRTHGRVKVLVDGKLVGYSPVDLEVEPGAHEVVLIDPPSGAVLDRRVVDLREGSGTAVVLAAR